MCLSPLRWPSTSSVEKTETGEGWDAWPTQPSLSVPSAGPGGQLRQRSAFTPATLTGSSPSPVLGQVQSFLKCIYIFYPFISTGSHIETEVSFTNEPCNIQKCTLNTKYTYQSNNSNNNTFDCNNLSLDHTEEHRNMSPRPSRRMILTLPEAVWLYCQMNEEQDL